MAYEPTNWKSGDVVTSAKLNKLEQAVASGGVMVVNATFDGGVATLDKTWQEIYDDIASGSFVYIKVNGKGLASFEVVKRISISDDLWKVESEGYTFSVATPSGYPTAGDK